MTDRVLVTGATGTVGAPLVRWLTDRPVTVRTASRGPERAREGVPGAEECVAFDLGRVGVGARTSDDAEALLNRPRRTMRAFLRDHADTLTATPREPPDEGSHDDQ